MSQNLESKTKEDVYKSNVRVTNAISYAGLTLLALAALDFGHTYFTGRPFVSELIGTNATLHEYLTIDAPLAFIGSFLQYESGVIRKVIENERFLD